MRVAKMIQALERKLGADDPFDVEGALKEVQEKTEEQVEEETAYKWGGRAIACYQLYKKTGKIKWFIKGEDYRHEAIEHAALVKDEGKVLKTVEVEVEKHRLEPKDEQD